MKFNRLSLLVAAAIGSMASSAFAININTYVAGAVDTIELRMSGASAQDQGIERAVARLCDPAVAIDAYTFINQSVYFCKPSAAVGLTNAAITKMVISKTSVGGSGNGVGPVANGSNLAFVNLTNLAANIAALELSSVVRPAVPAVAPDTIGVPSYTLHTLATSTPTTSVFSEVGFSDVEPSLLGATPAQLGNLNVFAPNQLIFAVPVTLTVRDKLQAVQSLAVGDDSEAAMPSLSRAQLSAIYTGTISQWSQVGLTGANAVTDNTIYMARRSATSGTQKSFDVHFTGNSCLGASVLAFKGFTSTTSTACGNAVPPVVMAGSGTDNVTECLNLHQAQATPRGAIGILSTESSGAAPNGFRFIKIDGSSPAQYNAINGDYPLWMETSAQYRKNPGLTNAAAPALVDDKKRIGDAVIAALSTEAVINSIDSAFTQPWGRSGFLAKPSAANPASAYPVTAAGALANPTNIYTKSPTGAPFNCQTPVKF